MTADIFDFRPIEAADKPAILAICAKIWDGDDYLPASFDGWLADREGNFTACLHHGALVGCGKLSFVGPGHAWLEGLRKDIDAPVKGVGKALCLHALRSLRRFTGLKSVRFATYIEDEASIHLNESIGFRRIATATMRSKIISTDHPGFKPEALCRPPDSPDTVGFSGTLRSGNTSSELMETCWRRWRSAGWFASYAYLSWRAYPLDGVSTLLALGLAETTLVYTDPEGQILGSVCYKPDPAKKLATVAALEADSACVAALLLGAVEQAAKAAGLHSVECMLPDRPELHRLFDANRYDAWAGDNDFLLYELPLDLLRQLD